MVESRDRRLLRALSYRFPTPEAALAEQAHLQAVLSLPMGTVHVVSDVHGEHKKLEHILRNASGTIRPLLAETFRDRLDEADQLALLELVYYPRESFRHATRELPAEARDALFRTRFVQMIELIRVLSRGYSLRHLERVTPGEHGALFRELVMSGPLGRDGAYLDGLLTPFLADDGGLELLREAARVVRALSVFELVVAGDLGDRGPRIDLVIDVLQRHRNVSFTWGNHDAEWMGACLGQPALIATVVRISLRYARLAQLEEGYGIPVEPLERLARTLYGDDPAERFQAKGKDLRDAALLARMQKAITVLQWKLEADVIRRHPEWGMEDRNLLHRIDWERGTVTLPDGSVHALLDRAFPSIDPADPYRLHPEEAECLEHLRRAFVGSSRLWAHMRFLEERGSMFLCRDDHVIFHGCVPCAEDGVFLEIPIGDERKAGRAAFEALDALVHRAFRSQQQEDVDTLYWLWAGPGSPLFGKDKMATFETYLVADKKTHEEHKDPYFAQIHERPFCQRLAEEFGVSPARALIVNGHVPVKLEKGESPMKRSGMAVTIDGAFSEAYGDQGYTLVIHGARTSLARHHHFRSVQAAVEDGEDIVPEVETLRENHPVRRVGDTERGSELEREIEDLGRLVRAYRERTIR